MNISKKQVSKTHYKFRTYMSKVRWSSIWHQVDEVMQLFPNTVLEVGPGLGTFKAIAQNNGINVDTLDIDPELKPDHVGSVNNIPISDSLYDVVCAFQILEHLPYDQSVTAFRELIRVSRGHVIISLPDAKPAFSISTIIPRIGEFTFLLDMPFHFMRRHIFDGEHYWEINKTGYPLKKVLIDFQRHAVLLKTYRVKNNPYHRFFIFLKP